jgi:hypothetical protein
MTHNHPHGGAFSEDDISCAFKWGLSELRAVSENFLYIMRPPKGVDIFDPELAKEMRWTYVLSIRKVLDDYKERRDKGMVNLTDLNEVGWDDVMEKFSRKTGLRYERLRWPDAKLREEGSAPW